MARVNSTEEIRSFWNDFTDRYLQIYKKVLRQSLISSFPSARYPQPLKLPRQDVGQAMVYQFFAVLFQKLLKSL